MFKPLSLAIACRYIRAKRRNQFISFISLISVLGIALGVAVLITVLSIMNGFDDEIRHRVFIMARQVTVGNLQDSIGDWENLEKKLLKEPEVVAAAPLIQSQGVLTSEIGGVHATSIVGIDPNAEIKVSQIGEKMISGSLAALKPGEFGVVIGVKLADLLGVTLDDKISLMIPETTMTPAGTIPRFRQFTVVGLFEVGNGFGFDSQLALIHLKDAQALFQIGDDVTGIRLKLKDLYLAPQLSARLNKTLASPFLVNDWTEDYGSFFDAIRLQKTIMFIVLLLIIAVAAFNLVSTLVMLVNDKRADIAIFRTLGATPRNILQIFIFEGLITGFLGILFGVFGGIILALNVTRWVDWIQKILHIQLLSSNAYFFDYLPSKLQFGDIFYISIIALFLSFLATLYPAWSAAQTHPAEALRYE